MRVFAACISHETSRFSPIETTLENFRQALYYFPETDPFHQAAWDSPFLTLTQCARERGHDVVAGLHAIAQPSAPLNARDWASMRDSVLEGIKSAGEIDGVLLMLHGAQMAEGVDDCEGDLLQAIRKQVGPDVFIGAELDLHTNLTAQMVEHADILVACLEYPHTDFPERGKSLLDLFERHVADEIQPTVSARYLPMIGLFHTTREPMRGLVDEVMDMETRPGVLSISLLHGFAWSDMPDTGAAVLVYTDGEPDLAEQIADELAREFFGLRDRISAPLMSIDDALDEAENYPEGPIILADASDNPGGGAAGDSTFILEAMLERGISNAAIAVVCDADAAQTVLNHAIGDRLTLSIGGKAGPASGRPLSLDVEVTGQNLEAYQTVFGARSPRGGLAAMRTSGIDIVLGIQRDQVFSPDCFTEVGVDVATRHLVVVKSAQHFQAAFAPLAKKILYVDAPGATTSDFGALTFRHLPRPIWPLDEEELTIRPLRKTEY